MLGSHGMFCLTRPRDIHYLFLYVSRDLCNHVLPQGIRCVALYRVPLNITAIGSTMSHCQLVSCKSMRLLAAELGGGVQETNSKSEVMTDY
jgi:hypothetical protein